MAPNLFGTSATTLLLEASQQDVKQEKSSGEKPSSQKSQQQTTQNQKSDYQWRIVWRNVVAFIYLHGSAIYGLYLVFTTAKLLTILWGTLVIYLGAVGVTAGAHRLWAHRSYKAKWPLRVILMIFQTIAFQNHIYEWVRDHRVHHKFTDTDADPHNSRRGFFFSHMGWLIVRKHPDVFTKGSAVDLSDLKKDPVVVWQKRLYIILMPLFCFGIPTWIPCYFWGERFMTAWYLTLLRYTLSLHFTWLVNSAAHMYGMKPFDSSISSTDSLTVGIAAIGEGWHNYHHVFPWDYKAAEFATYKANFTTGFIDMFAKIGWAYDLKVVPIEVVRKRAARTGDGSRLDSEPQEHKHEHHSHEGAFWGWGDKDMQPDDVKDVTILNKCD